MRISRRSGERTWPCTSDPQRAHPPGPITVPVGVSGQPAPRGDDGQITQRLSAISPTQPARFRYHRTLQAERARAKSVWPGMGNGSAPNSAALMSLKSGRGSRQCIPSLEMISPVQAPPFASQADTSALFPSARAQKGTGICLAHRGPSASAGGHRRRCRRATRRTARGRRCRGPTPHSRGALACAQHTKSSPITTTLQNKLTQSLFQEERIGRTHSPRLPPGAYSICTSVRPCLLRV